VYSIVLPFILVIGVLMADVADYGTLRLYSVLGLPWYVFLLSFSITIAGFEQSEEFLKDLRNACRTKFGVKKAKSICSARIIFGPMFHAKKSTESTYYQTIVDNTLNALLLA
jgi:hypothetical protein